MNTLHNMQFSTNVRACINTNHTTMKNKNVIIQMYSPSSSRHSTAGSGVPSPWGWLGSEGGQLACWLISSRTSQMVFFNSLRRLLRDGLVFIAVVKSSISNNLLSCSSKGMCCRFAGFSSRSTATVKASQNF